MFKGLYGLTINVFLSYSWRMQYSKKELRSGIIGIYPPLWILKVEFKSSSSKVSSSSEHFVGYCWGMDAWASICFLTVSFMFWTSLDISFSIFSISLIKSAFYFLRESICNICSSFLLITSYRSDIFLRHFSYLSWFYLDLCLISVICDDSLVLLSNYAVSF